jgi:hypothetical protein
VFDDDDRVPAVDEAVHDGEQQRPIGHVQPGGGLIEDVDGSVLVPQVVFAGIRGCE